MASGAKTAVITASHASDCQSGFDTACPPSMSPRVASTTFVIGLTLTKDWSHPGIDPGGANTELANVSGRMIMNPHVFTASGLFAATPMKAMGQHTVIP